MNLRSASLRSRWSSALLVACSLLALSACGGGEGGSVAAPGGGGGGASALTPRNLPVKPLTTVVGPGSSAETIFVKFQDGSPFRCDAGSLIHGDVSSYPGLPEAMELVEGGTWAPSHGLPEARLHELRDRAQRNTGRAMPDLCTQFRLTLPIGLSAAQACDAFNRSPVVEMAWPAPVPIPSPVPGDFQPQQLYEDAAPGGIDAEGAWAQCAVTGDGIRICDIEYEWNENHQDLPVVTLLGPAPVLPAGPGFDDNHGTAVIGELASLNNGFGTTGAAFDAQIFFAAANTAGGYDVGAAITIASATLGPGDVILIEQQTAGPNFTGVPPGTQFGLVPSEWDLGTYNAIVVAVGLGITVVEAAGNGSQNLDAPEYNVGHAPFMPANDSGAIIVGAGAAVAPLGSTTDRSRLDFSCYGSTVDLQGWGEAVVTTGYGFSYSAEGQNLWYTASFGGTSGASPIVTSAVALLQEAQIDRLGVPLTPMQVRDRLRLTGSPQQAGANPVTENIGPRPNVTAAIECLQVVCPPDVTVECTGPGATPVVLNYTVTDPTGSALTVIVEVDGNVEHVQFFGPGGPPSGGPIAFNFAYTLGAHVVVLTATNTLGGQVTCTTNVTIQDTTDPTIVCPGNQTVECTGPGGTVVVYPAPTVSDVCDPAPVVVCLPAPGSAFPLGTTTVTCTATDMSGNSAFCQFDVIVEDTTPPNLALSVARTLLWLPMNGMADVGITVTATDMCDADVDTTLTVFSDEGHGVAPLAPDALVLGVAPTQRLQLRAQRDAIVNNGRWYLVVVDAVDDSGNRRREHVVVVVPYNLTTSQILAVRALAAAQLGFVPTPFAGAAPTVGPATPPGTFSLISVPFN